MSHFSVIVAVPFGEDGEAYLEKALAPFNEQADGLSVIPSFVDIEEEYREKYRNESGCRYKSSKTVGEPTPYKQMFSTFEEYMKEYCGYDTPDSKTGVYGYWKNENAKWDWWQVGGRWSDFFGEGDSVLKNHYFVLRDSKRIQAKIDAEKEYDEFLQRVKENNVDLSKYTQTWVEFREGKGIEEAREAREAWAVYSVGLPENPSFGEDSVSYYKINHGGKEAFVKDRVDNVFVPLSFLDLEGEWHERADIGWFGFSSNEKDNWEEDYWKMIEVLPVKTKLYIVDCHI